MKSPTNRYPAIPHSLFVENRKNLFKKLPPNTLAVIHSNDPMPTGGDGVMPFKQNNNLFYLSGINQEDTILLLHSDSSPKNQKARLFVKKTSSELETWEGPKYTQEQASECAGISTVYWTENFPAIFQTLMRQVDCVYLSNESYMPYDRSVQTRNQRFVKWCKKHYPLHTYKNLDTIMANLRMIKSEIEINLIRKAYDITEKGLRTLLPLIRPGMMEYEIEAILSKAFIQEGATGFAYSPIIASGPRSCILHYIANNHPCKDNELILLDVGALYANYHADVTRVVPTNGRFTPRQKKIYNATLSILEQAKKLLVPGSTFSLYNKQVGQLMEKTLIDLGLISLQEIKTQSEQQPVYKRYFMHNISHHLGLNTHDICNPHTPFSPGMVLTVEPGIYIPEESFGIRLENAVVIGETEVTCLNETLPLSPDAIEELMKS